MWRIAAASPLIILLVLTFVYPAGCTSTPEPLSPGTNGMVVGTFNVHYITPQDTSMVWKERRDAVVDAVRAGDPDIIGFQEMETFTGGHVGTSNLQLDWLRSHLPGLSFAAVGDPYRYPWTQPIAFRSERFTLIEQGFFFFSPTPDLIYSRPWFGRYPSFCSWIRLLDTQTDTVFYVYNVHVDNENVRDRRKSVELVARRMSERQHPEEPLILLGDFNSPWFFKPVRILRRTGLTVEHTTGSTYHFDRGLNIIPAIDHVLLSVAFRHGATRVLRQKFDGVWPSDHYPVFVGVKYSVKSRSQTP